MPQFLEVAKEAAKVAGEYLLSNRGKITLENINEKDLNDFVTYVDHHSEKLIVDIILKNFPSHQILAEEGTQKISQNDYRWIIDPLDGTKNFIQNLPIFSISIAMTKGGVPVVGVVYDPIHDELFWAEKGRGAFCHDEKIKVSPKKYSQALIATGFPHRSKRYLPKYLLAFEEIFIKCSGMRRYGSAALDLCYTAMGKFEGFWELGLSIWDMAAGTLLIKEAGGLVSDFWGGKDFLQSGFLVAGNEEVYHELLKITKRHFPQMGNETNQ
jgi:myo-inositol-1(or 4)-monophosphatase